MATKAASTLAAGPFVPAQWEDADVLSLQALARGEASESQQKRALQWLIERASGTYEFHYYPSERDTAFALGRAFVGQQVVKMLKLNLLALRRASHVEK